MHVLYELREYRVTVVDDTVEEQLRANADDKTLRYMAIARLENKIEEYRAEHDQIQQSAAQFTICLKSNSITPYNDATIAYLDFLLREEKHKVDAEGNSQRYDALTEDREKYQEYIATLQRELPGGAQANLEQLGEAGIDGRIKALYALRHFGDDLKSIKQIITEAHEATNRERPHRVQRSRRSGIKKNTSNSMNPNLTTTTQTATATASQSLNQKIESLSMQQSRNIDGRRFGTSKINTLFNGFTKLFGN